MNLEFLIRMRDMMSGGLVKLANTAQSAFNKVQQHVSRTTSRNKYLSSSFDEIQNKIRQVEQTINRSRIPAEIRAARRELEQLQRMSNNHAGNTRAGGGGFMGGMLRQALPVLGIAGALSLGGNMLSHGLEAQARQVSFEVMGGKKEGGKLNSDLTKYAQDSIYGNEVFKNAQTMMGFGANANEVMPGMKMLGDIAMGDANKLGSLTLAFSQVRAAGKLTGQDLLQFVNAGFNPLQEIAAKTGMSLGELKKAVSDGAVSFKMVEDAFKSATGEGGRFYNMTERIAETDFGKVQAFQGQLEALSVKIGGMLAPVLGNLISNYLVPFVEWLSQAASWIQANSDWIGLIVTVLGTLIVAYQTITWATSMWTAAQGLLNIVMSLNPIVLVIALIAALVAGVIYAWNKFEGFRMVVWGLWGSIKQVFTNIGAFFKQIFNPIFDAIEAFKDGRWADGGIAVAKIGAAIATGGASAVAEYAMKGGFTAGVADAYKSESLKGINKASTAKGKTNTSTPEAANFGNSFAGLTDYSGSSEDSVKGVTSSGPRVININGVRFADKIEIHTQTFEKGLDDLKEQLDEYMLRLLYSGGQMQD